MDIVFLKNFSLQEKIELTLKGNLFKTQRQAHLLIAILSFLYSLTAVGQIDLDGKWTGTLINETASIYPVQLKLKSKAGIISGEMSTYGPEDFSVVTAIKGKETKGALNFWEDHIISLSDSSLIDEMCFINFKVEHNEELAKEKVINGTYIGYYKDKTPCDSGNFVLKKIAVPKKLVSMLNKRLQSAMDTLNSVYTQDNNDTLSSNEISLVELNNSALELIIWDNGIEDGDSIRVIVADKIHDIELRKKPVSITHIVEPGSMLSIEISALNTGAKAPNTGGIRITKSVGTFDKVMNLNTEEHFKIVVYHK